MITNLNIQIRMLKALTECIELSNNEAKKTLATTFADWKKARAKGSISSATQLDDMMTAVEQGINTGLT